MKDFDILRKRLADAGVEFVNQPHRLHYQRHGELGDTFLVWYNGRSRTPLDTMVDWSVVGDRPFWGQHGFRHKGLEAIISKWSATSIRKFVRGSLYLKRDTESSAYGASLAICEGVPETTDSDVLKVLRLYEKRS